MEYELGKKFDEVNSRLDELFDLCRYLAERVDFIIEQENIGKQEDKKK